MIWIVRYEQNDDIRNRITLKIIKILVKTRLNYLNYCKNNIEMQQH